MRKHTSGKPKQLLICDSLPSLSPVTIFSLIEYNMIANACQAPCTKNFNIFVQIYLGLLFRVGKPADSECKADRGTPYTAH